MGADFSQEAKQLAAADTLDRRRLMANHAGDMALLAEVIELFNNSSPGYLADIRDAVARGDSRKLQQTARKFRGAVGNLCATATAEAMQLLETIGRANRMAEADDALATAESELTRLQWALVEFVHSNTSGTTGGRGQSATGPVQNGPMS